MSLGVCSVKTKAVLEATFLNWNKFSHRTVYNKMADSMFDTPVLEFRLIHVFGKYSVESRRGDGPL